MRHTSNRPATAALMFATAFGSAALPALPQVAQGELPRSAQAEPIDPDEIRQNVRDQVLRTCVHVLELDRAMEAVSYDASHGYSRMVVTRQIEEMFGHAEGKHDGEVFIALLYDIVRPQGTATIARLVEEYRPKGIKLPENYDQIMEAAKRGETEAFVALTEGKPIPDPQAKIAEPQIPVAQAEKMVRERLDAVSVDIEKVEQTIRALNESIAGGDPFTIKKRLDNLLSLGNRREKLIYIALLYDLKRPPGTKGVSKLLSKYRPDLASFLNCEEVRVALMRGASEKALIALAQGRQPAPEDGPAALPRVPEGAQPIPLTPIQACRNVRDQLRSRGVDTRKLDSGMAELRACLTVSDCAELAIKSKFEYLFSFARGDREIETYICLVYDFGRLEGEPTIATHIEKHIQDGIVFPDNYGDVLNSLMNGDIAGYVALAQGKELPQPVQQTSKASPAPASQPMLPTRRPRSASSRPAGGSRINAVRPRQIVETAPSPENPPSAVQQHKVKGEWSKYKTPRITAPTAKTWIPFSKKYDDVDRSK